MKKLQRKTSSQIIAGVCSGIAEYLGVDPTVIRLILIVLCFLTKGIVILFYVAAVFLMPSSFMDDDDKIEDNTENPLSSGSDPQSPDESRSTEEFNSFFK